MNCTVYDIYEQRQAGNMNCYIIVRVIHEQSVCRLATSTVYYQELESFQLVATLCPFVKVITAGAMLSGHKGYTAVFNEKLS